MIREREQFLPEPTHENSSPDNLIADLFSYARRLRSGRGRVALAAYLVYAGTVILGGHVGADSPTGQAFVYPALPPTETCSIFTPNIKGSTVVVFNRSSRQAPLVMDLRDENRRQRREATFSARSVREIRPPVPEVRNEDPNRPNPMSLAARMSQLRPTSTPTTEGENNQPSRPTSTCNLSAVVYHDNPNSDGWAAPAFTEKDVGDELFLPEVYKAWQGRNTTIVIHNPEKRNASVSLTFRSDRGEEDDFNGIVRAESSIAVDTRSVSRGVSSLVISGPSGAQLMAAAYHTGPMEMAASYRGVTVTGGTSRVAVPLLFNDVNGNSSEIRVMNVGQSAVSPEISYIDRDSEKRIGPVKATDPRDGLPVVLREGQGYTFLPDKLRGGVYSAIVNSTSGGKMAVSATYVNMRNGTMGTYEGIPIDGVLPTQLVAPWVVNRDGMKTGIQVQNLDRHTTSSVKVELFDLQGNRVATKTATIGAYNSSTFYLGNFLPLESNFVGRAEISGPGGVAAVINTVKYPN